MKLLLLSFFSIGFLGFFLEGIYNRLTINIDIEKKLKKPKASFFCYSSIWMLPVYNTVGFIITLIWLIPIKFNIFIFALISMIIISIIEYFSGILLNKKLKLKIWDYSNSKINLFGKEIKLNLNGQIDIWHTLGWFGLAFPLYLLLDFLSWLV